MKLEYSELEEGIRLIKLTGVLDADGANQIDAQLIEHCQGENVFVLVDLSRMTYISSIGIPLLINAAKGVTARGGRLAFVNPQLNVKAVLELTGVLHVIRVYQDIEMGRTRIKLA